MKELKKKSELQSRREFFKNAAKSVLPILGIVMLPHLMSCDPMDGGTESGGSSGCSNQCTYGCGSNCASACRAGASYKPSSCGNTCKSACSRTCKSLCMGGAKKF